MICCQSHVGRLRSATYNFVLTFYSNHGPVSYRFRDKRWYQSKIAKKLFVSIRWASCGYNACRLDRTRLTLLFIQRINNALFIPADLSATNLACKSARHLATIFFFYRRYMTGRKYITCITRRHQCAAHTKYSIKTSKEKNELSSPVGYTGGSRGSVGIYRASELQFFSHYPAMGMAPFCWSVTALLTIWPWVQGSFESFWWWGRTDGQRQFIPVANGSIYLSIYSYNAHNSRTEHCRAWNPATAQSPV